MYADFNHASRDVHSLAFDTIPHVTTLKVKVPCEKIPIFMLPPYGVRCSFSGIGFCSRMRLDAPTS
jgi:hypothetical protein